ncbi:MAG TPA: RNA polymerase sigma factor [Planctomycetaceae bacterium]|nr:RNA polymerase sigma factor [Planctomycetaceae bacterium]
MMTPFAPLELAEHRARLYRVALRILGDHHAAEEVAQDVCLRALEKGNSFAGRSRLTSWLHRVAVNCALDRMRKNSRERNRIDGDREIAGVVDVVGDAPDQIAEQRDQYRVGMQLLAGLPDDCRHAFVLTQLDGYSYDEAAEIEGKPRGTIASRVARAKSLLCEAMRAHSTRHSTPANRLNGAEPIGH